MMVELNVNDEQEETARSGRTTKSGKLSQSQWVKWPVYPGSSGGATE